MNFLKLEQITINLDAIAFIEWGSDKTPSEAMPDNTTELNNPNKVTSPKVAVIHLLGGHESALSLVIDRESDDFEKIKSAIDK